MSSMTGRRVTGYAVKKHLTAARAKLEEKQQDRTSDDGPRTAVCDGSGSDRT